jgi:hypothetical protein
MADPPATNLMALTAADPSAVPWQFNGQQGDPTDFMQHLTEALGTTASRRLGFAQTHCRDGTRCTGCGDLLYIGEPNHRFALLISHPSLRELSAQEVEASPPIKASDGFARWCSEQFVEGAPHANTAEEPASTAHKFYPPTALPQRFYTCTLGMVKGLSNVPWTNGKRNLQRIPRDL